MKTETRVWAFVSFVIALALVMLCTPAFAGGDDIEATAGAAASAGAEATAGARSGAHSSIVSGDTVLQGGDLRGGDVSVGGDKNRAYALSNSLGDVDLGPCYGSTQWNTVIVGRQTNKLLPVQCAENLDAMGLHEAAARMRCSDKAYAALFVDRDECIKLSKLAEIPPGEPESVGEVTETEDDEHDIYLAFEQRLKAIEEQNRRDAAAAQAAARQARAAQQQIEEAELARQEFARETLEALKK